MNAIEIKETTRHALERNTAETIVNIEKEITNNAGKGYSMVSYKVNLPVDTVEIHKYFCKAGFIPDIIGKYITIRW